MRLNARDRRALRLGAALLLCAAFVRFGGLPLVAALSESRSAFQRETALLNREYRLLRDARALPARFDTAANEYLSLATALLPGSTADEIIAHLAARVERIAARSPVLLTRIEQITADADTSGIEAYRLRVEGEGDLEGILSVVAALEAGPRLLRVDDLSLHTRNSEALIPDVGLGGELDVIAFALVVTGFALPPHEVSLSHESRLPIAAATAPHQANGS
jgi:type II secretory pathway component PulM